MKAASFSLVKELLLRDLRERYAGTVLGVFWLLLNPLFMLLVYALVFGEVLQLRLDFQQDSDQFAAWLFAGLLAFNAVAEVLSRAPSLLLERRELLLNSPLPAGILPLLPVGTSLVLELLSVTLLLVWLCLNGSCQVLAIGLYLPWLLLRLVLSLAVAYLFAILGVFLRDLRQLMAPLLTVLLLVSAIVYPLSVVPVDWQWGFAWNPLVHLIEGYRQALLQGEMLWLVWSVLLLLSSTLLALSYALFRYLLPRARYVL